MGKGIMVDNHKQKCLVCLATLFFQEFGPNAQFYGYAFRRPLLLHKSQLYYAEMSHNATCQCGFVVFLATSSSQRIQGSYQFLSRSFKTGMFELPCDIKARAEGSLKWVVSLPLPPHFLSFTHFTLIIYLSHVTFLYPNLMFIIRDQCFIVAIIRRCTVPKGYFRLFVSFRSQGENLIGFICRVIRVY